MWVHRPVILACRRTSQRNPGSKADRTTEQLVFWELFQQDCLLPFTSPSPPYSSFFAENSLNSLSVRATERCPCRKGFYDLASWHYILAAIVNRDVYKPCIHPHRTSLVPFLHFTKSMGSLRQWNKVFKKNTRKLCPTFPTGHATWPQSALPFGGDWKQEARMQFVLI